MLRQRGRHEGGRDDDTRHRGGPHWGKSDCYIVTSLIIYKLRLRALDWSSAAEYSLCGAELDVKHSPVAELMQCNVMLSSLLVLQLPIHIK